MDSQDIFPVEAGLNLSNLKPQVSDLTSKSFLSSRLSPARKSCVFEYSFVAAILLNLWAFYEKSRKGAQFQNTYVIFTDHDIKNVSVSLSS